jgi:hypothetical protein
VDLNSTSKAYLANKSPYPIFGRSTTLTDYESRNVTLYFNDYVSLALPDDSNFYSGVRYILVIDRETGFYSKYYIGPAIIFVLISYTSFWISRAAPMARISLCTGSILMTV